MSSKASIVDIVTDNELINDVLKEVNSDLLIQAVIDRGLALDVAEDLTQDDLMELVDKEEFLHSLSREELVDELKTDNKVSTFSTRDWDTKTWVSMNKEIVYCSEWHTTILVLEDL